MRKFSGYLVIFLLSLTTLSACHFFQHTKKEVQNKPSKESTANQSSLVTQQAFIKQIVALAKKGFVSTSEFAAHTNTIAEVEKKWGNPAYTDKVENIYYANYPSKKTVFGYNANKQIVDVRSYDKNLTHLTYPQIKNELGNPAYARFNQNDQIYGYKLNNQFELRFIITKATGTVDHISVYSPEDAKVVSELPPYILPVKGNSKNLSPLAWKNMQDWRNEMIPIVKKHPNTVFLNGPNKKIVALTFDDGPDNVNTPKIIDTLAEYKVKGNFFFIGEKVKKYPNVVKKAFTNGNIVLSHSYYHHDLSKETGAEIKEDLAITDKALFDVIGKKPALLRPPFGAVNETVISTATENDEKVIIWSIDTLDWSQKESNNIVSNVMKNVRNGDIILMHSDDDKEETAKALPRIIESLKQKGFDIVDLPTLLNTKAYK